MLKVKHTDVCQRGLGRGLGGDTSSRLQRETWYLSSDTSDIVCLCLADC